MQRGAARFDFPDVIVIAILEYAEPGVTRPLYHVELRDDLGATWTDGLLFEVVSLANFDKKLDELESPADDWLYLLKNLPTMTQVPPRFQTKPFAKLISDAEYAQLSPAEQDAYDAQWFERVKRADEYNSAIEIGEKRGELRGEQRGEERAQARANRHIVLVLHRLGQSPNLISETSGVPLELIHSILKAEGIALHSK